MVVRPLYALFFLVAVAGMWSAVEAAAIRQLVELQSDPEGATRDERLGARDSARDMLRQVYPSAGSKPARDVPRLILSGGVLELRCPKIGPPFQRFSIEGSEGLWGAINVDNSVIRVRCVEPEDGPDNSFWQAIASKVGGDLEIQGDTIGVHVVLNQSGHPGSASVSLVVEEIRSKTEVVHIVDVKAESLLGLRREHPAEFRQYVAPLLNRFSTAGWRAPGPAEVYRIFGDLPPDPAVAQAIEKQLPDLASDAPDQREAARAGIQSLGEAAVPSLLHLDLNTLSPEQQAQVLRLLNEDWTNWSDRAQATSTTLETLADCLEYPSRRVRDAALHAIEQKLKVSITGLRPPDQIDEAYLRQVERLRNAILTSGAKEKRRGLVPPAWNVSVSTPWSLDP